MTDGWWRRLWRHQTREPKASNDMLDRFGYTCPVCGLLLGETTPVDSPTGRFAVAPSLRLYMGVGDLSRSSPWRVSIVEGNYPPATSTKVPFSEQEVAFVYLLCGGGHIFPDAAPILHGRHSGWQQRIDTWNMVAALGATASGKTYLLLRTLHQSLVNESNLRFDDNPGRVKLRQLSPLEDMPLSLRATWYEETRSIGRPIPATGLSTKTTRATPADILNEVVPDALSAIQDLVTKTVLDGAQRAESWGTSIRQPLVLRTDTGGRSSWTGVADLPGELFSADPENLRASVTLRAYDVLVWVIDPVVAANALTWLDQQPGQSDPDTSVLDGSLRPGSTASADLDVVRTNRDQIQHYIGRTLTMSYNRFADHAVELLVAVNKCDLIHAALRKGTLGTLADLGDSDAVRWGVMAYLLFMANRIARRATDADATSTEILEHIYAGEAVQQRVREERAGHLAEGLLIHYSQPEAFWRLVHRGEPDSIMILGEGMNRRWDIHIPGIGDHIDASMQEGSTRRMLVRDLVMSAIGCGVAYGLGNGGALISILHSADQDVRFFLCSPLATVPVARQVQRPTDPVADVPWRLFPRDEPQFPRVDDRSAALTQLLLAMLRKVRR